jgi:hypothetical protein
MACEKCGAENGQVDESYHVHKHLEAKYKKYWRPIAAYVYLTICLFDFMGMPIYTAYNNSNIDTAALAEIRLFEDPEVRKVALAQLNLGKKEWHPITLEGGALFHLSFGAIIGISAFSRGQEKKAAIQRG